MKEYYELILLLLSVGLIIIIALIFWIFELFKLWKNRKLNYDKAFIVSKKGDYTKFSVN